MVLKIPLIANGKIPAEKGWQEKVYSILPDWKGNVGMPCEPNNITVVDFDVIALGRVFYRQYREIIRTAVVTPRPGVHFWFEGLTDTRKFDGGDIRSRGSLVVIPDSEINGNRYRFPDGHGIQALCAFPEHLFPHARKEPTSRFVPPDDRLDTITRAMKYAERMEPSVSGQHGHDALYRFCCKMVRRAPHGFGLAIEEAWPITLGFNNRCLPPWDERDLRRKLAEARRKDES